MTEELPYRVIERLIQERSYQPFYSTGNTAHGIRKAHNSPPGA